MAILNFSVYEIQIPFWRGGEGEGGGGGGGKFGPKNQSCQFKLKCGTLTNSNMQTRLIPRLYLD